MRLLIALFLINTSIYSQNERLIRKVFSDDLRAEKSKLIPSVTVETKDYLFDLTGDFKAERFKVLKQDNLDVFKIFTNDGKEIFRKELHPIGKQSSIYKVKIKTLSSKVKAIVIYYFEGIIDSTKYQSQTKAYMVTIEDNNLDKIYSSKSHYIENEYGVLDKRFYKSNFFLKFKDFNKDGIKDAIFGKNGLTRVLRYEGKGLWSKI